MEPIKRAARALCAFEGHPENIKFKSGKPGGRELPPGHSGQKND